MPISFFGKRPKEDELEQSISAGLGMPEEERVNLERDVFQIGRASCRERV